MKLHDFRVLTFDCYGTLIDWETGIWTALQPLVRKVGSRIDRDAALVAFGEHEARLEIEAAGLRYDLLLARVHAELASAWGVESDPEMDEVFGRSVPDWPAFPDSPAALAYLKQHYKLVILSNVHRAGFAGSNRRLGVEFDAICTAEDIGSYKPSPRNFDYVIAKVKELGHDKSQILHTAQSLHHDHVPAERAGLARCWINRRGDTGLGSGATKPVERKPSLHFEFPTLAAMAEAHRREAQG